MKHTSIRTDDKGQEDNKIILETLYRQPALRTLCSRDLIKC